jgi:hypothetical protein
VISGSTPEDNFIGVSRAMTELVCDRFVGVEDDSPFNVVPMRLGQNTILLSFVLSRNLQHVTPDGITEIPAGTALTVVVQEFIEGNGSMDLSDDISERTTTLWDLRKIMEN